MLATVLEWLTDFLTRAIMESRKATRSKAVATPPPLPPADSGKWIYIAWGSTQLSVSRFHLCTAIPTQFRTTTKSTFRMKKVDSSFLVWLHWSIQNSSCTLNVIMREFYTFGPWKRILSSRHVMRLICCISCTMLKKTININYWAEKVLKVSK